MAGKAVSECPDSLELVIDGLGERDMAPWGGANTYMTRIRGVAGVAIDGAIRDSAEIAGDALPVFARSIVPNAYGAECLGELLVPVPCVGLPANPGDWVDGDLDGVDVVSEKRVDGTLVAAERSLEVEAGTTGAVLRGEDLGVLLRSDEVLSGKCGRVASAAPLPGRRVRRPQRTSTRKGIT